jgi:DNA-directed RNA polymerase specialized sigma24 family protein
VPSPNFVLPVWDRLAHQAHALLISPRRDDLAPSVMLARSLHPTPPSSPAAIRAHVDDAPHVLPALVRYAQAGDRHALLMAAVLMRDRLHMIAVRAGGGDDVTEDTLTLFWTFIRTAAEPRTLTAQSVSCLLAKLLQKRPGTTVVVELHDPHAAIFDQAFPEPERHGQAAQLLDEARSQSVITALEYRTLTLLYLQGVDSLTSAARILDASAKAVERRAQRAIRKLTWHYRGAHHAAGDTAANSGRGVSPRPGFAA